MAILYDLSKLTSETRELIENSAKYTALFSKFPNKLLGYTTSEKNKNDAKTGKSLKYDILTAILYLIPSDGSGFNLCPMAKTAKCDGPCLNTAGRGAMGSTQMSRLRKTLFMLQYPKEFEAMLREEIRKLEKRAKKLGLILKIRLNGTSDWNFLEIIRDNPDIQFYDYTKVYNRLDKNLPSNYHVTLSYSEADTDYTKKVVDKAKAKGINLAVVFRDKNKIPTEFLGRKVIDGDQDDLRFLDPDNVIVALYAKGQAKKDHSGFVIDG